MASPKVVPIKLHEIADLQQYVEIAWGEGARQFELSGTYEQTKPIDAILDIHAGLSGITIFGVSDPPIINGNRLASHVVRICNARANIANLIICGGDATEPRRVANQYNGPRWQSLYQIIDGGGVLILDGAEVHLTNCAIVDNRAGMCGGGISVQSRLPLRLNGCLLENNTAQHTGAAIDALTTGADVYIRDTQLRNNTADQYHGQITLFPGSTAHIEQCTFEGDMLAVDVAHGAHLQMDNASGLPGHNPSQSTSWSRQINRLVRLGRIIRFETALLRVGVLAYPRVSR